MTASATAIRSAVSAGDESLAAALEQAIGAPREGGARTVSVAEFDRIVAGVDASHVLLTPEAVVTPQTLEQVAAVLGFAAAAGRHVTVRSGGTSLSGQASGDGILLDTRSAFRRIDVEDGGARVRVQPGATVRQVNARLIRHGRKLGPDPASEIAATIGGVIANNSSGMACGTHQNSYRTLASLTFVLPSGTIVDTARPDADARLASAEPALHAGLTRLRDEIRGRADLVAEIERQYRGKNTMGYGLNSFLDFGEPVQILAHLLVGSEGTLGFVAEAVFDTVTIAPAIGTALLVFDSLDAATGILPVLVATGAATLELMDAASLRVIQADPTAAGIIDDVVVAGHAALLVEYHGADDADLAAQIERAGVALAAAGAPALDVTRDATERARLWHFRKGLYAAIAGARKPGTTALLEDIAVPVEQLAGTCAALQVLFERHGYDDAVIFGHAKDGNIHFLLTEDFTADGAIERQALFTEELVELVLGAGGTLKAEHGTGRIMAPFVERQFGPELYAVMREVKRLADPRGVLNPGVLLTDSPTSHLEHLKVTPEVEAEVDRCVECGYCEPVCPSKDVTLTPRQRIAVRRARAAARAHGDTALDARLAAAEQYASVETCAADGMCQTACPVLINTGDLVRRLREQDANAPTRTIAAGVAKAWGGVSRGASVALSAAKLVPPVATLASAAGRVVLGSDVVPQWSGDLPRGGAKRAHGSPATGDAVFFSACVGSMFGPADGSMGAAAAFRLLAERAGVQLITPERIDSLCCGTPWKSKGLADGYRTAIENTVRALLAASEGGFLPIVCDNSSCTEGLVHALENVGELDGRPVSLTIIDAVDFAAEQLLPGLPITEQIDSLALHPTCSSTRLGSNEHLRQLAGAVAVEAVVPDAWGCCAFAGDRGMLHPELTASATAAEAAELAGRDFDAHASCNRTCEIGMTRATGESYVHILELLERATR
ncbi:FAD-binding and (Fe-S)-binding domain-containing protein [Microterricola pindariensis]|uniref:D-lactate dehydrogenase (cytochrome) n=1 Tax=Microterricola pindariensis TaxID=478010 RepID=A0ABX5B1E3_9MICO|nr:FAD-binding and (Fe-S)-binding domain-containing protein [Microterricola pindariensis]PPL20314.1 FAD-binding oxidoreductase [Microterricola pindariensis]